jgi:hypothetical protein
MFFRPGLIIGFFGSLGSGKTLMMTAFTDAASRSLGIGAVANYDTDVASRLENLAQLVNSRNVVIAIDEIHAALLDSRAFKSQKSIATTQWVDLIRKDSCLLFYTAQSFRRVDVRLRDLTNYLVFCRYNYVSRRVRAELFVSDYSGQSVRHVGVMSVDATYWFGRYNTRDKRVVLSDTKGGRAYAPLAELSH